jgi:hypothetical protein
MTFSTKLGGQREKKRKESDYLTTCLTEQAAGIIFSNKPATENLPADYREIGLLLQPRGPAGLPTKQYYEEPGNCGQWGY